MGTNQVKKREGGGGGLILIALGLAFAFYQNQPPTVATTSAMDSDHARAYVAGDFAFAGAAANPAPAPSPEPTPGKCTVCNGTGKVGDGRIFVDCGTCGGDGVIEKTEDQQAAESDPEVQKIQERLETLYSETPEEWAARTAKGTLVGQRQVILYRDPAYPIPLTDRALEALKDSGWTFGPSGQIDIRPYDAEHKHGTWVLVEGGRELASQWIDMTANQIADFYTNGTELRAVPNGYALNFSHRSTWSHPGEIRQHLMGSNHGFTAAELNGLSNAQLEALHSSEHERGNPRRSWGRVRTYRFCPSGNCP